MEHDLVQQMRDAREASLRILQRDAANQSVNLVAERQQVLRKVTSVLSGDAGNERSFGHRWLPSGDKVLIVAIAIDHDEIVAGPANVKGRIVPAHAAAVVGRVVS